MQLIKNESGHDNPCKNASILMKIATKELRIIYLDRFVSQKDRPICEGGGGTPKMGFMRVSH